MCFVMPTFTPIVYLSVSGDHKTPPPSAIGSFRIQQRDPPISANVDNRAGPGDHLVLSDVSSKSSFFFFKINAFGGEGCDGGGLAVWEDLSALLATRKLAEHVLNVFTEWHCREGPFSTPIWPCPSGQGFFTAVKCFLQVIEHVSRFVTRLRNPSDWRQWFSKWWSRFFLVLFSSGGYSFISTKTVCNEFVETTEPGNWLFGIPSLWKRIPTGLVCHKPTTVSRLLKN